MSMIFREVRDPLALKRYCVEAIRHYRDAFDDSWGPCPRGCLFCPKCVRALKVVDSIFRDDETTVYEVDSGIVFFTQGNILHAFFTDGQFVGKVGAILSVARAHQLLTGIDVLAYVPHSSRTISEYLQRNGFRLSEVREGDFLKDGITHNYDMLEIA